jgi:hypothetical protein
MRGDAPHPALRATLSPLGRGDQGGNLGFFVPSPLGGEGASRSEAGEGS